MKKHAEQIRRGSLTDPGQRSVLSHTHTPGDAGQPRPSGAFAAMGTRGTQPRAWGTSLLWLLAKTNCNPTRVFSCKASATLVDGIRFKPGPSNLLTWSCETAASCRSHVSGFACKCHSFGVQVMGLVGTTGGTDNAHQKSQSSEDKGLVLFSRGI